MSEERIMTEESAKPQPAFCFGHVINESLSLIRKGFHLASIPECTSVQSISLSLMRIFNALYQLYILFKYSNVVINHNKSLARFGVMHVIASCMSFWMETVVKDFFIEKSKISFNFTDRDVFDELDGVQFTGSLYPYRGACSGDLLAKLSWDAVSYLYPFTIEFNLVRSGVWFVIWLNIGNTSARRHNFRRYSNLNGLVRYQSNITIRADCHSANKGIFAGIILMVTTLVSIIMFFISYHRKNYYLLCWYIHLFQEGILIIVGLTGIIFVYVKIYNLDYKKNPVTFLDDILLFIPLPFFFVYSVLSIIANFQLGYYPKMSIDIASVIQVIIQTLCIVEGLRRCSNSNEMRYKKPGREMLTFLIICNVMLWLVSSFEYNSMETIYRHIYFRDYEFWPYVSHVTFPLMIFYRFHASVCLADMWRCMYEKCVDD
ncbi:Otopetrin [Cordylochernes scorpioides]|uniref:Otopetrin n=1 Tax=Cordylochernes scorpioides TaxID=51811 RepID=A0ABY6LR94_9ARAC|nr:Otopetrin [Cordylochernes scorpioides]